MATRSDIIVLWHLSPRIVLVQAPSTELVIQDLHDTLRDLEDEPSALIYPTIISTAGKEALGGGVSVGLTSTLLNAQVAFEARPDEYDTGTATGGSAVTLVDAGADFVNDGVLRGDIIENSTDGSQSSVLTVVDGQNLDIMALSGGSTNTFTSGDEYVLWHVEQCNISGGNLVAVDDVGTEISPILPTFGTQVIRTSSSSATLLELSSLEHSTFEGGVTIDAVNGVDSYTFPAGTHSDPVKTLPYAKTIAVERGFSSIYIIGDLTISASDVVDDYKIYGQSPNISTIILEAGSSTSNVEFFDANITGDAEGVTNYTRCHLTDLSDFEGTCIYSQLNSTLALKPGSATSEIIDSWSGVPGLSTPILDMGGTGTQVAIRRYAGGLTLQNYSGVLDSSIDILAGHIKFDTTITAGTFIVRGVAQLTDNSTGTANIVSDNLVNPYTVADQVLDEDVTEHTTQDSLGQKVKKTAADAGLIPGQM